MATVTAGTLGLSFEEEDGKNSVKGMGCILPGKSKKTSMLL